MKTLVLTTALAMIMAAPLYAQEDADTKTPAKKDKTSKEQAGKTAVKADYVVMKVGSEEIKKSEVETVWKSIFPGGNPPPFDTFEEKIRENVLRGIASEHIIENEAQKSGIKDSPEVKERLVNAEKQIVIQEFLKQKTKELVTDDRLKAMYDERVKNAGDEVHARHILVKTEDEAKEIEKRLKKGDKFEDIAKEKSEDKSNSSTGGDLGWFTNDKMVPEFSKVAFSLKKGDVSEPVKSEFGWHIIKVEDRRKSVLPPFDQMKEQLKQEAGNKAVADYVNSLMKNIKVTVYDDKGNGKEMSATIPTPAPEK